MTVRTHKEIKIIQKGGSMKGYQDWRPPKLTLGGAWVFRRCEPVK